MGTSCNTVLMRPLIRRVKGYSEVSAMAEGIAAVSDRSLHMYVLVLLTFSSV